MSGNVLPPVSADTQNDMRRLYDAIQGRLTVMDIQQRADLAGPISRGKARLRDGAAAPIPIDLRPRIGGRLVLQATINDVYIIRPEALEFLLRLPEQWTDITGLEFVLQFSTEMLASLVHFDFADIRKVNDTICLRRMPAGTQAVDDATRN